MSSGGFEVETIVVSARTPVEVTAGYEALTLSAPLELLSAVFLQGLTLDPASVTGGESAQATVALSGAAPAGGVAFTLAASSPTVTPPADGSIAAGDTATTFAVQTAPVGAPEDVVVFATYGDSSVHGRVTVEPPAPLSLWVAPATVIGGNAVAGTLTLNAAAPAGGIAVALSASDPSVPVSATVAVPAGATSVTFPVPTNGVAAACVVTLQAGQATTQLAVEPASLVAIAIAGAAPTAAPSLEATVTLNGLAPPGGAAIALSSADGLLMPASSTVTVPSGQRTATIAVTATGVAARTATSLAAVYNGVTQSAPVTLDPRGDLA